MTELWSTAVVPTLIVAALVIANGLFVAAEFAIVGAPRATIDRLANAGNVAARLVRRILADQREVDRFIATAQLGITLASLGLGMYGEHLLAEWLSLRLEALGAGRWIAAHTLGSVIAIAILTYIHIVVGEMVPKSIALAKADRAVLWIAPVMRAFQLLLFPFVVMLNGIGNATLALFGVRRQEMSPEAVRTPDELAYIVRESSAGGLLKKQSATVVQELLEYLFPEPVDSDRFNYFLDIIFLDGLPPADWTYEWQNYLASGDDMEVRIPLGRLFNAMLYAPEYQVA